MPRDPDSIRRAAHDILAQPQFRTAAQNPLQRAYHWLGQQLDHALNAVLGGGLTLVGGIVLALIVAGLIALIVWALRNRGIGVLPSGPAVSEVRRPPAEWLAEAVACERRGDWRASLRARYRALVAELARRGLVEEIPGRTTGEYRAELRASLPVAASPFAGATDLFEVAVYGHADVGPAEAAQLQSLADRVLVDAR